MKFVTHSFTAQPYFNRPAGTGPYFLPIPGTSYLATFIQSLRDKNPGVLLQRPAKLTLLGSQRLSLAEALGYDL
jgi:hypothetical protein